MMHAITWWDMKNGLLSSCNIEEFVLIKWAGDPFWKVGIFKRMPVLIEGTVVIVCKLMSKDMPWWHAIRLHKKLHHIQTLSQLYQVLCLPAMRADVNKTRIWFFNMRIRACWSCLRRSIGRRTSWRSGRKLHYAGERRRVLNWLWSSWCRSMPWMKLDAIPSSRSRRINWIGGDVCETRRYEGKNQLYDNFLVVTSSILQVSEKWSPLSHNSIVVKHFCQIQSAWLVAELRVFISELLVGDGSQCQLM